jgi:beta-aspartyl-peptidase (threonine type)
MKKSILSLFFVFIAAALVAGDFAQDAKKIRTIMDEQVKAWNDHNIDGFMAGYQKSESFTFQSGNKRLTGWETLRAMYKKNYAGEKMGTLTFTDIEMKPLAKDFVLVMGRWRVDAKGEVKEGLFSLVFQRFDNGWKIIHDHSS